MNETFKTELAAFARDVKAICDEQLCCEGCPIGTGDTKPCAANYNNFNADKAIAAVEAYRKRKKPCAEVIDECVDLYTIEVEVDCTPKGCYVPTATECSEAVRKNIEQYYGNKWTTVRVLSSKRFVLKSHREDAE